MTNVFDGKSNKIYSIVIKIVNNKPAASFSIVGPNSNEVYEALDNKTRFVCHNKIPDPWSFRTYCYCIGGVLQNKVYIDLILEQDLDASRNWLEVAKLNSGQNATKASSIYLPAYSTWHQSYWNIVLYHLHSYSYGSNGGVVGDVIDDDGI